MKIFLALLALLINSVTSFTLLPRVVPGADPPEDGDPGLMIEKPPTVNVSDIVPIIKKPDEVVETDAEASPKETPDSKEVIDELVKPLPGVQYVPAQTPIPHTGNVDNANLLEYSAPQLNGNGNKFLPVKHNGKDGDNSIDYNDYVTLPIDVFKQQI